LSEIYFKTKQFERAYEFRLKYEQLKDSIFSKESNQKINELEARYQNNVKKNEIKDLLAANTINELNLKKQKNTKYVLIAFALILLVISSMIFNQYRLKKKSNILLQNKNQIIEVALGEKEILLQEVHHRVKNNLQFVWSLLNMHTRHIKDKIALDTLVEAKNRIKIMALIHQKLYQNDNLKGIDLKLFIPNLTENLLSTYETESRKIELETDIEPMVLDVDTAMPIALIINELVTNSVKYAFDELEHAKMSINLKKDKDFLMLTVKDNGKGFNLNEEGERNGSFGLKLINSLAKQLKAEVIFTSEDGVVVQVKITKYNLA
jgi:two-component sensor histidine kinase